MDVPAILKGPRLKIERAHKHVDELIALTNPLSKDFYAISIDPVNDIPNANGVLGPGFGLLYKPKKPVAEHLALVIGDAVHNLRGALDHLTTGIIRTRNPTAQPHFPMFKHRHDFVAAPVFIPIEEAAPGAKEFFLEKIRPANGANEALWGFHVLDNDDKHNLLIPTVAVVEVRGINATIGGIHLADCSVSGNAARKVGLIGSVQPFTANYDAEVAVEVRFSAGGPFQDQPVIPTLLQLCELVSKTVKRIGTFLNSLPD